MADHTPGPWESHYMFTPESKHLEVQTAEGRPLAHVYAGGVEQAEVEANAEVMAAAPQLLTALRNLVNDFDASVLTTEPMLIEAREAIGAASA